MRQEIHDIVEFWCEKGVDGFRMDVISLISKQPNLPDSQAPEDFGTTIKTRYANGPKIHQYLHELNQQVLSKYDVMTVGEGPGIDLENGLNYVDEERQELNMIFHFDHMFIDNGLGGKYDPIDFTLPQFKAVFSNWDERLKDKGWGSIFLGNHDFSRMVNRFGNAEDFHDESAKLLALMLFTLRGTVYVYQGDEIGMTNVAYPSIDFYNDVETLGAWNNAKARGDNMTEFLPLVHRQSRDNARTPMQWNSSKNAGFSTGEPWLQVNENHQQINVEIQEQNPNSLLHFYSMMNAIRKHNLTLVYCDYLCLNKDSDDAYFYKRWDHETSFLVLLNFSDKDLNITIDEELDSYTSIVSNYNDALTAEPLRPWEARLLKK